MSQAENVLNSNQTILQHKASARKCWICLAMIELDMSEIRILRDLFLAKSLYNEQKTTENFVQLRPLFNKIVLSACKCRKKLAHESCFSNYIDLRQNGNVKIQVACPQCHLKYEFSYPYNGVVLQTFDLIDQFLNMGSSVFTVGSLIVASYWCSFSFGLLTILQIYGNEQGAQLVKNSNIFVSAVLLPVIPIFLVLSRCIPWYSILEKAISSWSLFKVKPCTQKYQEVDDERYSYDESTDDDSQENSILLKKIRLVVGGLTLPTIAVCIDKLILTMVGSRSSPSIVRTSLIGLAFVGVKGIAKMVYKQKKSWEEENKSIQDYKSNKC